LTATQQRLKQAKTSPELAMLENHDTRIVTDRQHYSSVTHNQNLNAVREKQTLDRRLRQITRIDTHTVVIQQIWGSRLEQRHLSAGGQPVWVDDFLQFHSLLKANPASQTTGDTQHLGTVNLPQLLPLLSSIDPAERPPVAQDNAKLSAVT